MAKKNENTEQNNNIPNGNESVTLQADVSEPVTQPVVTKKYLYIGHPDVFGFKDGEKLLATGCAYELDSNDPTTAKLVRRNKLKETK